MNYKDVELSFVPLFPDLHTYRLHTIQKSTSQQEVNVFFSGNGQERNTNSFYIGDEVSYTRVCMPVSLEYNLPAFIYKLLCLGTLEWQPCPPMHQTLSKLLQSTILLSMVLPKLLAKTLKKPSQLSNPKKHYLETELLTITFFPPPPGRYPIPILIDMV